MPSNSSLSTAALPLSYSAFTVEQTKKSDVSAFEVVIPSELLEKYFKALELRVQILRAQEKNQDLEERGHNKTIG